MLIMKIEPSGAVGSQVHKTISRQVGRHAMQMNLKPLTGRPKNYLHTSGPP